MRRASARRNAFTVREMASRLYATIDDTRLGAVRRAMRGLVTMGLLHHDGRRYSRTAQPLGKAEWSTPVDIVQIEFDEAGRMLDGNHYLGAPGWNRGFCLTTPTRDALAVFGPPVASHFKKVLAAPLELTRLWRTDDCPFPLSQFLARSIRWIKREAPETDCIFSYADPGASNPVTGRAHIGGIYTASNFVFIGYSSETSHWIKPDGSKVSSPQCYRMFKTKSLVKVAELQPDWKLVKGLPKPLYVYPMRLKLPAVLEAIGGDGKRYGVESMAPEGYAGRSPQWVAKLKTDLGDLY